MTVPDKMPLEDTAVTTTAFMIYTKVKNPDGFSKPISI
jgi:hypothetical protein